MAFNSSEFEIALDSISGGGLRIHYYETTDTVTEVSVTDYVQNAASLGVRADDLVIVNSNSNPIMMRVVSVSVAGNATLQVDSNELPHVEDWRGFGGDFTDTGMFQAAVADADGWINLGVDIYSIEETIVINRHNVGLIGKGQGGHEASSALVRSSANTRLLASGGLTAPVVSFTSVAGSEPRHGGGLRSLMIDGNLTASRCLEILSWRDGVFKDLHLYLAANGGANLFTGCFGGTLLSTPYDTQRNLFRNISSHFVSASATQTAYPCRITGGQGNGAVTNGNTSLNVFMNCQFIAADQDAIFMEDCDSNFFFGCSGSYVLGSHYGLVLGSSDQNSTGRVDTARSNQFHSCTFSGVHARASQLGNSSSHDNCFYGYGRENNNALPTIERGAGGSLNAQVILYPTDRQGVPKKSSGYLSLYNGTAAAAAVGFALDTVIALVPFVIEQVMVGTSLNIRTTTGAGSSAVKMAIWQSDANTGLPLLTAIAGSNTGQATTSNGTTQTVAIDQTLYPGLYWYGCAFTTAAPTVVAITNTNTTLMSQYGRGTIDSNFTTGWTAPYAYASSILSLNLTTATLTELSGTAGVPLMYLGT